MDVATRTFVRRHAKDCCEYCQRRQIDSPLIPLQIEHVTAKKHGGSDDPDNLALACAQCNLRKGSDLAGIDPDSNQLTPLFHPRKDVWHEHFAWSGVKIVGLTAVGRTTVRVLDLNITARLRVRLATWRAAGREQ